MFELIQIKPTALSDEDIVYLKKLCAKIFKDHEFRYESNGFISLTKESWANPESFSLHWYEFVVSVLPPFVFPKYYWKHFVESCIMPPKNSTHVRKHPIEFIKIYNPL